MEISVLNSDFHGNSIHIVAFQHGFPDDFVQARFSDDHFWGVSLPRLRKQEHENWRNAKNEEEIKKLKVHGYWVNFWWINFSTFISFPIHGKMY